MVAKSSVMCIPRFFTRLPCPTADRTGRMRGSPKRCGSVCARLSGCGSALSRRGWKRRCCPGRARGFTRANWTASRRPSWWRWPARNRPRASSAGRCDCWPNGWWNWRWCPSSATRRCARRLEKKALTPRVGRMWCPPPKPSAGFVFHVEVVLVVYHRRHDPQRPVVCLDECSKQLIGEVRTPVPPRPAQEDRPGRAECYDCEYVRNGTATLFMAFEPLGGWREVAVTEQRRREDWAHFVRGLVDGRYREADKIVLVMDQLNTHSPASLYQAFPPEEAKRLADRLEIHHMPKHGSWLNMAEIELSALGRDLPDRVGDRATLERQVQAWQHRRNAAATRADWQFTTNDARIKLRNLYPIMEG